MANVSSASRVVFVGNLPYNISDEEVVRIFSEVGPVKEFRPNVDKQTGRPKGYGFLEFYDHETALSAVRNLHDNPVGGRALKVDIAPDDPKHNRQNRTRGGGGGGGEDMYRRSSDGFDLPMRDSGWGARAPPGGGLPAFEHVKGVELAPGKNSLDAISHTLATMPPEDLINVMSQMQSLVEHDYTQVQALLRNNPQLAYALLQGMLMMNVVDPAALQRVLPALTPAPAPASVPPPSQQQYTVPHSHQPAYPSHAPAPPTPAYGTDPNDSDSSLAAKVARLPPDQQQMVLQVFAFTADQIAGFPPDQQASIAALKQQFGKA